MRRARPGGHATPIFSAPCVSSGHCATRVFFAEVRNDLQSSNLPLGVE